jgi:Zn-dependent M28 family amino/carboxypeptidase
MPKRTVMRHLARFSRLSPLPLLAALVLAGGCAPADAPQAADPGALGHPDRPLAAELGVEGPTEGPALRITRDRLWDDTAILSADSMLGRAPGTVGEERAVRHIERRMAEAGLETLGDHGYRLPIELLAMTKRVEASTVRLEGPGGALPVELDEVPLVFVGYGVEAPEYGWDDFRGEDVAGKVLLFLNDDPAVVEDGEALFGGDIRTYYGRWTYKYEQAQRHGAAGAIVIHTDESAAYGYSVIGNMGERQMWQRDYRLDFLAWMDSTMTAEVAAAMGTDVPGLFEMGNRRDFRPVDTGFRVSARIETEFERVQAPNVAGVIRGSDPELRDEYVVFTAHHDHLGVDPSLPGDSIFNGALDNALGVAGILALGDAFAEAAREGNLRRSVIILSVTAEEGGLIGSGQFVESPPVPLASIVANFNVDSPQAYGPTRDVAAIGLDMNEMGLVFGEVVRSYGLEPAGDPNPMAGSFYRSDQLSFAKAGIPALYLQRGTLYARDLGFDPAAYHLERYHQVTDEMTPEWDLTGLERDLRVLFEVALRVANADAQPRWFPGNEFESQWQALYGR